LKGYIVREKLETPELEDVKWTSEIHFTVLDDVKVFVNFGAVICAAKFTNIFIR